jgi:prevent-host-death family protein
MSTVTINSREARSNFRSLLDRILAGFDVVIERNGKAVAVLIPVEDYMEIQDELDDMRAARRAAALYESWKKDRDVARPLEDIEAELMEEGLLDESRSA